MSCCNKCKKTTCCCGTSAILRYTGPDIPELGISTNDLIEVVIQNITQYILDGTNTSVLTDNGDGTYSHDPGDGTGTIVTFIVGKHTTGLIAHVNPHYGDTWYDTVTGQLKWFTNNGTIDVWYTIPIPTIPSLKAETIHHNVVTLLTIDPTIHSKRELHFESTGNMTLNGNDHLVSDDYTYLIVNTTAVDRFVTFSNIAAAYIRDGGAIMDLSGAGFTIPSNTTMLMTVTNVSGTIYVNGQFFAIEEAGDPINLFNTTVNLVGLTPLVVNVPTMVNLESILLLDSLGVDITSGVAKSVAGDNITLTSNVGILNVQVRVIFSI